MRYGTIGHPPREVSRLVYGCDRLGQQGWGQLDAAFKRGVNAFDTARVYHASETVLGAWMSARGIRDEVFIITKGCFPSHRLSATEALSDLDQSLRALRTDYIDLYLLHCDAPELPMAVVAGILDAVKSTGRVRAIGLSNFSLPRVENYASLGNPAGLDAVSVQLSLPVVDDPMWPQYGSVSIGGRLGRPSRQWYSEKQLPVLAYSCLGRGFFSRRFDAIDTNRNERPARDNGVHGDQKWLRRVFGSRENAERRTRATQLAAEKRVTPAQIALAYIFHFPINVFAVGGWSSSTTCDENVRAVDISLTDEEFDWLALSGT